MAIASVASALDFRRIVVGLQIVCNGDYGQQHRRQHRQRDDLDTDSWQQICLAPATPTTQPSSPEGDYDRRPDQIE